MDEQEPRARELVETLGYEAQLQQLEPDVRQSDDFLDAVTYLISQKPTIGARLDDGSDVWFLTENVSAPLPPIVIAYTFDENKVILLGIHVESVNGESGVSRQ